MAKKAITHIMVLVDGSQQGFRAAEAAIGLAREVGAKLTAMAVIDTETLKNLLTYRILATQEMSDFQIELETSARKYLDRVRTMALDEKVAAEQVLVKGPYHTSVLSQQKQLEADLVVIGAFQSGQATRDLLARELQKITDMVPCPVMMVK
ncbi:MAG: universal stress protein [Planctomycetes bacterium]|nr:universal stress protein [Planctomycetota bacterium]